MAKRSPLKAITSKQSSAYKGVPRTPSAIHALGTLKGWPGGGQPPQKILDEQAEKVMSGGYSNKRNPICPRCYVRQANNGSCCE
jgi:hypothetical protein